MQFSSHNQTIYYSPNDQIIILGYLNVFYISLIEKKYRKKKHVWEKKLLRESSSIEFQEVYIIITCYVIIKMQLMCNKI